MDGWLDYPGCSLQPFPQTNPWTEPVSKIGLHSTEGSNWPGYSGGASAPHLTVNPRTHEARQHFPFTTGARAFKNLAGGIETNRAGIIQIEIIGSCNPPAIADGLPSVIDMDEDALAYLGGFLKAVSEATGVPLVTSVDWVSYPESYGFKAAQRLSNQDFLNYRGVLGHQHVPENDHGDPGNISIARILEIAGGSVTPVVVSNPKPTIPGTFAPPFPLPNGYYFGPKSGPNNSVSGYYSHRDDLARWQQRMHDRGWRIGVDGLYGDETGDVAEAFQREKGLGVDRLIGPATWAKAWTAPIT